ncbi:hypothetical protein D4M61_30805, partial [Klebsiella pneumoniae]
PTWLQLVDAHHRLFCQDILHQQQLLGLLLLLRLDQLNRQSQSPILLLQLRLHLQRPHQMQ